jgi:hypothetical protein
MEVTLLTKQFPSAFGLVSDNLGLSELGPHLNYLVFEAFILVVYVSYQPNVVVVEGSLLLQLEPLLLEDIQSL